MKLTRGLLKLHTVRIPFELHWQEEASRLLAEELFSEIPWLERVETFRAEWRRGKREEILRPRLEWDQWYPR